MDSIDLKLMKFKMDCYNYLSTQGINVLRAYGRKIGVAKPTEKKKSDLLDDIILVLTGEMKAVRPTNLGAPIKNDYVDPRVEQTIYELREKYFSKKADEEDKDSFAYRLNEFINEGHETVVSLESPDHQPEFEFDMMRPVYRGQLHYFDNVAHLLSTTLNENDIDKVILPPSLVEKHDLREGDVVSCYARQTQSAYVAYEILTRNDQSISTCTTKRCDFDTAAVQYPNQHLKLMPKRVENNAVLKSFDWLFSLCKGQRVCLIAPPKAGKTNVLYQLTKAATENCGRIVTYALLIDQTPEIVRQFSQVTRKENFLSTTYEDDADKQVFAADFILRRAKRDVESGKDVLLVVDSLTSLSHLYNETEQSSGGKVLVGGLESKTLQYIKKYFGAARALEEKGSLTIIAALSTATGNPADELLCTELSALSNLEVHLSEELSTKHIYPAFDYSKTRFSQGVGDMQVNALDQALKISYLSNHKNEDVLKLLSACQTPEELLELLKK